MTLEVALDHPVDVAVDAPRTLELVDGHRRQLLAHELEEVGGVLARAGVDVDDEGAVVATDDGEVANTELGPADAGGGVPESGELSIGARRRFSLDCGLIRMHGSERCGQPATCLGEL